ncbi:hypothetical protein GUITHDRAFT_101854 [Guillardia theta CCMP2712]|uniref:JmjC domain-containing protein n=1 Tax=Guillardia theta (strain CCMP2712) TaxID=905079 RepID=L1JVT4_GUITC|nr:hypothetical protein GUITHDRAFT_101854 [Guillardia theta CCMP2712]EKX52696.1 hypothetical protein GUITHDRAFT_101854 [Guillardia theta CCMP2712]|eukprot:XP_005839676.1 hypothetical protein GUITHDRAFT_101854 [Guillardia theta CCMP2712]
MELSEADRKLWALGSQQDVDQLLAQDVQFLCSQSSRTCRDRSGEFNKCLDAVKDLQPRGCNSIEYIQSSEQTTEAFHRNYAAQGRPCMILGCSHGWRAKERWRGAEELVRWYGDVAVRVTEIADAKTNVARPLRISLRHYVSYASQDSGGAEFPCWILFPPISDDEVLKSLGIEKNSYKNKMVPPCIGVAVVDGVAVHSVVVDDDDNDNDNDDYYAQVPEGWWHAVLNLDFTAAITANPLLPATLPRVLESMNWPKTFLWKFVLQAAERWPELKSGGWGGNEEETSKLLSFLEEAQQKHADGYDEFSDLSSWLRKLGDLHLKPVPPHAVVIIDTDSVLVKRGKGVLHSDSLMNLQRIIKAVNAEIVPSGPSRTSQALRDVKTLRSLCVVILVIAGTCECSCKVGDNVQKILDFVSRQCNDDCPWVVIDEEVIVHRRPGVVLTNELMQELGEEGPDALMLHILLRQQCISTKDGITDQVAAAAVEKLLSYMEDE